MNRSENINDAAKNELRRRRQKAEQIAADRRAELCKKSEKFARLEQKYNELSKALVKAAISGNAAERTALSGELSHTAKEEEKILEASGIDTDFLKPQYRCKKCGDQGVLSNGQACDCLKKLESDLRYAGSRLLFGRGKDKNGRYFACLQGFFEEISKLGKLDFQRKNGARKNTFVSLDCEGGCRKGVFGHV